ncbi:MAG TPA: hypothetical protein VGE13_01755 [Candidatus Saccharimonadales bacterium]
MIVKTRRLNAVVLRIILSISLLLVVAVVVAGFTFTHQMLTEYAISVGRKNIDAQSSDKTLQALTHTEKQLADNTKIRDDANKLRLDDEHPEFAVRDVLTRIAKDNKISISIASGNSTDSTSQSSSQTQAPTAGTTTTPTPAATSAGKTFKLAVSVKPNNADSFNRDTYKDFLQFLRDLEQSLPKIKINGVEVSGGGESSSGSTGNGQTLPSSGGNSVSIGSINLEIYIK